MSPAESVSDPVDPGRLLDEGPWTGAQQRFVALTALTIIFDGADNQLLANVIPAIMREWGLTRSAFAPALAVGLVGMTIGSATAGMIGDRIGRKFALLSCVLAFGLATMATVLATDLSSLAVCRFLAGLGLGGAMPNAAALAAEFVPRRHRSFAVTLTIVCVPLGGTLAGLLAIRMLPIGWRSIFVIGGLVPVAVALVLMKLLPESPRYLASRPDRAGELRALLARIGRPVPLVASFAPSAEAVSGRARIGALLVPDFRRDTLALWGAFFFCLLAVYLGFNWVPSMLTGAGLSATVGSAGITAFNLGGVAGAIGGASAFARIGSRVTMLVMAAGAAAGALTLASMPIAPTSDATAIIVVLGLTGGLINAVQTTMFALATQIYPTAVRATGVGTAASVGRLGGILSSFAGAWTLEAGGAPLFFGLLAAAMVSTAAALALVKRHIRPSV
jgi:MFS transporter, AAHS family, 4-hydroxybenzoate transporter